MKLLVFAGSQRQQSYNRALARAAVARLQAHGATPTLIELADYALPLYDGDLQARGTPEGVLRFKSVLDAHPVWLICSPEHNASPTALLKNAIDWASSPVPGHPTWSDANRPFAGKVVGLLSAAPGALGGLRSLNLLAALLRNLECWVCPRQHAVAHAGQAFTTDGLLARTQDQERVDAVLQQLLWAGQRLGVSSV